MIPGSQLHLPAQHWCEAKGAGGPTGHPCRDINKNHSNPGNGTGSQSPGADGIHPCLGRGVDGEDRALPAAPWHKRILHFQTHSLRISLPHFLPSSHQSLPKVSPAGWSSPREPAGTTQPCLTPQVLSDPTQIPLQNTRHKLGQSGSSNPHRDPLAQPGHCHMDFTLFRPGRGSPRI